ncbi:hypothetical protein LZC95_48935 [Pendulispora brunnea]|uniref:Uncharacterized protein n=1 Tax=Pendulispora brunnea TaxID=2905690 RepID=A0ABZ2K9W0_9BACT
MALPRPVVAQEALRIYLKRPTPSIRASEPTLLPALRDSGFVSVLDAPADKVKAVADTEGAEALWLGPSVGFDVVTYHSEESKLTAGIIPGVGYGIKWKPSWYHLNKSLLAADLFIQGVLVAGDSDKGTKDVFNFDLLPVVTILDWVGVGFGERFHVGPGATSPDLIISFGVKTST